MGRSPPQPSHDVSLHPDVKPIFPFHASKIEHCRTLCNNKKLVLLNSIFVLTGIAESAIVSDSATMKTKRNKPAIGITIDCDVKDWLLREARSRRLKTSQYVNQILADAMRQNPRCLSVAESGVRYGADPDRSTGERRRR